MDEKQRYEAGMQVRRAVLGDAHVDRSLEKLTPFNEEFQEMITRHAWGDIWTRPGLPRHTRSLITIAMLIGMNREGELKLHLKAAKNNGVTREELKELIMQSALYCGIPAANATFHLAEELWDNTGSDSNGKLLLNARLEHTESAKLCLRTAQIPLVYIPANKNPYPLR